jgi:CubicO group peptidase (beta-lactamase class C family)
MEIICKTVLWIAIASLIGSTEIRESVAQDVEGLHQLFGAVHDKGEFSGSVVVLKDNQVVFQKHLGYADFREKKSIGPASIFEFASIGKIFTAVSIAQLVQAGKINLDDPVANHLKSFPYPNITIRHLLQHLSGLPDYMTHFENEWSPNKRACNQDVIDWLADKKPDLLFEPGKEFRYSNTGYVILASIVEDASGLAFSDYLQRNIFEPLGMNSCFAFRQKWHANLRLDHYALGHRFDSAANKFVAVNRNMPPKSVYHYSLRSIDGDGNVVGTLADFVKFEQGLAKDKLRIGDLMGEFYRPAFENDGSRYGFAFYIASDNKSVWHYGNVPGYQTYYKRFLNSGVTIIYTKNIETTDWSWLPRMEQLANQH